MEHLVPEQMFSTEDNPAHGISAVKAIQIAAAEGQKIWTITQANLSTALAEINLPSAVESDIRNSVYAGMEVTAHEAAINFYGSSQVGYIVIDPETGSGGYLIGGGENGAFLKKLKDLFMKVQFWLGTHLGASGKISKYRLLFNSVGVIIGVIFDLITVWSKCRGSVGAYLSLFSVLTSTTLAIALFFATGGMAIAVIGFLLPLLQSQLVKFLRDKFC